MRHTPLALATFLACVTTPGFATSIPVSGLSVVTVTTFQDDQIFRIKNDTDKGQKKANKNKPKKARKDNKEEKRNKPSNKQAKKSDMADKNKPDKIEVKARRSEKDRVRISNEVLQVPAPHGRDMSVLLGAAPLALLGSRNGFPDVSDAQLLTYRNCPPGLGSTPINSCLRA